MVMTLKEGPLLPSVQNASVSLLTWQLPTLRYHSIPSTGLDALALVMWSSYILWLSECKQQNVGVHSVSSPPHFGPLTSLL